MKKKKKFPYLLCVFPSPHHIQSFWLEFIIVSRCPQVLVMLMHTHSPTQIHTHTLFTTDFTINQKIQQSSFSFSDPSEGCFCLCIRSIDEVTTALGITHQLNKLAVTPGEYKPLFFPRSHSNRHSSICSHLKVEEDSCKINSKIRKHNKFISA